jgi:hypothetical protein
MSLLLFDPAGRPQASPENVRRLPWTANHLGGLVANRDQLQLI